MINWKKVSIPPHSSIKHCLTVMDQSAQQITLVVDEHDTLCGTITDGDVRRGLLSGLGLEGDIADIVNKEPKIGSTTDSEAVWLKLIQLYQLKHLPIVDSDNKIVGLFQEKTQSTPALSNPIVLMLGGMGARLRPLTNTVPKPMLVVGDKPILETIVNHISEQGFEEFYFCINYLGEQIRDHFGDGSHLGIRIQYIEEKERMGTAGALSLLPKLSDKPIIVMNGDLLTKVDLRALVSFHEINQNEITACVREYSQQIPYGVIEMDGQQVTQMVEKPVYRYFVNGGIYALSAQALTYVPNYTFYDMPTLVDDVLADNQRVGGFPITEYWMDIGQLPDYEQAQADYDVHFKKKGR